MCGRFSVSPTVAAMLADFFGLSFATLWPHWDVRPTEAVATVRWGGQGREAATMRWGLVAPWAAGPRASQPLINARAETVATKPTFRRAIRERRCLVPASGFYEWLVAANGRKLPVHFTRADEAPLVMAGLWERWEGPDGEVLDAMALLTTTPNALIAPIHDRMPVILAPADFDTWLRPGNLPAARALLVPFPAEGLRATPLEAIPLDGPALPPRQPSLFD